jgi:hypothetical protein
MGKQGMHERRTDGRTLPAWLWLGLPLLSLAIKFLSPLMGYETWERTMLSEFGFVENATAIFCLPAAVLALIAFRRRRQLPRGMGVVLLVFAAGCIFFAGEEISWGQHMLGYETPGAISEINRQDEFNLHNTYSEYGGNLLNNVPRQLLNLAMTIIIVWPIVLRVLRKRREKDPRAARMVAANDDPRRLWYWILPSWRLIPAALMALVLRMPNKLDELMPASWLQDGTYPNMALMESAGEYKEYCFAMAMLLWAAAVWLRLPARASEPSRDGRRARSATSEGATSVKPPADEAYAGKEEQPAVQ